VAHNAERFVKRAAEAKRSSKRVELKESFDPRSSGAQLELVRDVAAMANSGGGVVVLGGGDVDEELIHEQLARYTEPEFEAFTQHLSITTFRYVPRDLRPTLGATATEEYLQQLNQELLSRVERSGEAFLSNAMIDGRFALRACIVNFRTSQADIEALLPLLTRLGAETDRASREK